MSTAIAVDALAPLVGTEVALSGWFDVGQARIDAFADATDDHQWIHTDPERCRHESPYGQPVAHGVLTLSLLPAMLADVLTIGGMRIGVNYGLDRVRFPAPLPAGSRQPGAGALDLAARRTGGRRVAADLAGDGRGRRAGQAGVRGRVPVPLLPVNRMGRAAAATANTVSAPPARRRPPSGTDCVRPPWPGRAGRRPPRTGRRGPGLRAAPCRTGPC